MKVALIQLNPVWENTSDSIKQVEGLTDKFEEADLLVFPEMSLTGYTMNSQKLAEELDGESTVYFIELARQLKKHIVAGIIEKAEDKTYNSAVHFNRDGLISARYRKIHPFSMAEEHKYYSPSNEVVTTKIDDMTFGLSVCYDLRFPELYRLYGKQRVDGLINIANWPIQRIHHWDKLLAARSVENLCYMIGCNRTGKDPFYEYCGNSSVYSPMGEQLACMSKDETVALVEIEKEEVDKTRLKLNFLDDIKLI